jgi:molybdopterin synthase catalytic subunit
MVLDWEAEPPHLVITRELVWEDLRWTVTGSLDAELTHAVAKRVWMEVQDPCRTLWTIYHSTGVLKGGEDMVAVYLVQR